MVKSRSPCQIHAQIKTRVQGSGCMGVAVDDDFAAHFPDLLQKHRTGVGEGAVSAGNRAGVHLQRNIPRNRSLNRFQSALQISGISLIEILVTLVEFADQVDVPDECRAAFRAHLRRLTEIARAVGIIITAEELLHIFVHLRFRIIRTEHLAVLFKPVGRIDQIFISFIASLRIQRIALNTQQNFKLTGMFFLHPRDFRPV